MKKKILKIISNIMFMVIILLIVPVDAVRFKIKVKEDAEVYIISLDDNCSGAKSLRTFVMSRKPSVLLWNGKVISIREKSILKILRNRVIAGGSLDKNYDDVLAKNLEQDYILYKYLKHKFSEVR